MEESGGGQWEESNGKKVAGGERVKEEEQGEQESSDEEILSVFPLSRVKKLMQCGTEETIKSDAIKVMSKAAVKFKQELFIQEFAQKVFQVTKSRNKKTAVLSDLLEAINNHENLSFLKDTGILQSPDPSKPSE